MNRPASYPNAVCVKCGRGWPETILNIEAVIHHGAEFACIDTKSCNRARRKRDKKK